MDDTPTPDPLRHPPTLGTGALRTQLGARVEAAHYLDQPTVITSHGRPRAAIVPYSWLQEMLELQNARTDQVADIQGIPERFRAPFAKLGSNLGSNLAAMRAAIGTAAKTRSDTTEETK